MSVDIEKRNKRQYNWQKEAKDRINFLMDKGTKDRIKLAADKAGTNSSEFIRTAIEKELSLYGFPKSMVIGSDLEDQEPKKEK